MNHQEHVCKANATKEGTKHQYDFDLIVLGGGSGGLAAAKEASVLGARVALLDFVTPTPRGTKWGLGGTCVNVGCIPKKLMHEAALLGEALNDARFAGWNVPPNVRICWSELKEAVGNHIKSVNWSVRVELTERKIHFVHGIGVFKDVHTITVKSKDGVEELTGENILIAVGGRPKYLDIPGAVEYGITSDDLFHMEEAPGKTLIVGGGYVAMECAGFLKNLGFDVTLMNRTDVVLRRFDQQMVGCLVRDLEARGVRFLMDCKTKALKKQCCSAKCSTKRLKCTWEDTDRNIKTEEFDTVLFAIGRRPLTKDLEVERIGIKLKSDKIEAINEQTHVSNIYAVGDVLYGRPELTPVASLAGKLLARRLFGNSSELMNYDIIGTTVFTPLEYGCVGLSEEKALSLYGEEQIEIYHSIYNPLEFAFAKRHKDQCYLKCIVLKEGSRLVLGMHFVGISAGEVIQGFVAAMKCGLTSDRLFSTVGLHVTNAEEFTKLVITKKSGEDPTPAPCCN